MGILDSITGRKRREQIGRDVREDVPGRPGQIMMYDSFWIKMLGLVLVAEVVEGVIKRGSTVISPSGKEYKVTSIEFRKKNVKYAERGMRIGISLHNTKTTLTKIGSRAPKEFKQKGQILNFH